MNAIQQISLKLQLGIDPAVRMSPETLRALWQARLPRRPATGTAMHFVPPPAPARTARN